MKHVLKILCLVTIALYARNPFFLKKSVARPSYVLKGTLISANPLAYIEHQGQLYIVGINDTIGKCIITEIKCGIVQVKHNGRIEVLQLEQDKVFPHDQTKKVEG